MFFYGIFLLIALTKQAISNESRFQRSTSKQINIYCDSLTNKYVLVEIKSNN